MPDEFPTLEVVALIGVVAAFVGTLQLRRSQSEIPKLAEALGRALRAGNLAEARSLCGHAEGASFSRIGLALVDALEQEPRPDARELAHVVAFAQKRATRTAQRGRGRDLVVAGVLVGAAAYAWRAALGVGIAFYVLIAAALLATALGPVLRRSMLDGLMRASNELLAAATDYLAREAGQQADACPRCHGSDAVCLRGPALDPIRDLGLEELKICRRCGLVRGEVPRPEAIAPDPARGIGLTPLEPELESSAEPDREHEG